MKKKIYDIIFAAQYEGLTTKEATDQLLVLFGVVGRSERLPTDDDCINAIKKQLTDNGFRSE